MLIKFLGILDIICFILMVFYAYTPLKFTTLSIYGSIYLLVKGILFLITGDLVSILDIISGVVLLLLIFFTIPKLIVAIISIFLLQKGLFSLLN